MQSICADAGVTTGALYKRYKGKADLFEAVVAPTLADIRALEEEAKRRDYALMDDKNLRELWALSEDIHRQWMIYFYEDVYKRQGKSVRPSTSAKARRTSGMFPKREMCIRDSPYPCRATSRYDKEKS